MSVDDTIAQMAPGSSDPLAGLVGQTLGRRYRIESLLGEGGMGAVYRAHHLRLQQDVAVKVLRPELSNHPEAAPRFEREAQASSRLEHPHIVRVIDFGEVEAAGFDSPVKFLVMQLLEGQELSDLLGQPLGIERSLKLVAQILDALVHAHERGVVHRDLKPDNVFVTTDHTGEETLKLVDFGIAKLLDDGGSIPGKPLTQVGMVFGTPAYMSPEQAVGNPVDERTDVYAVGVMLYEMLSGQRPFRSSDPMTLLRMQILAEVEPIEGLRPDVQTIILEMMAKDPAERTPTAAAALLRVQQALGPAAMPPSTSAPLVIGQASGPNPAVQPFAAAPTSMELEPSGPVSVGGRPKWLIPAVAGAVLLLGLGVAAAGGDGEESDVAEVAEPSVEPEVREAVRDGKQALASIAGLRAPEGTLEELDRLIKQKRLDTARAKLDELDKKFRDDPNLAWRRARMLRPYAKHRDEMFVAYVRAIELDAGLLNEGAFRGEVERLLSNKTPHRPLVDAVAASKTSVGTAMLTKLANRSRNVLRYGDRHAVLEALGDHEDINRPLNVALDLWQADQSEAPCATFVAALGAAETAPDPFLRGSVERAPVPKPGKSEEPTACDGAEDRRKEVAEELAESYPDAKLQYPADYKKQGKARGGGRRRRGGVFRRIFR